MHKTEGFLSSILKLTSHPVFRLLSSPRCPVLEALGKNISFETAIGLNGRVWVYFLMAFFNFIFVKIILS